MKGASELLDVLRRLRAPDGCPWDREQTLASLRSGFLEEVHEFLEALDSGDGAEAKKEWGDVVFNLWFYSELAREAGWFDAETALEAVKAKLVSRHPHVFDRRPEDEGIGTDEVLRRWEARKAKENAAAGAPTRGILDGVTKGLPALVQSFQLQAKAAHVGFDWPDAAAVRAKVNEELAELDEARTPEHFEEELGDLLFTLVNLARHRGADPDKALAGANRKFRRRFQHMEESLRNSGGKPSEMDLAAWDVLWNLAKRDEKAAEGS